MKSALRFLFVSLALAVSAARGAETYEADFVRDLPRWQEFAKPMNYLKVSTAGSSLVLENTSPDNSFAPIHPALPSNVRPPVEITARVRLVSAPAVRTAALLWNALPGQRRHFEIEEAGGSYSLYDWEKDAWFRHRERATTSLARNGEVNELTIRLIGQRAFHLLNGTVIDVLDAPSPTLTSVGLFVAPRTTLQVDALTVRSLAGDTAALAASSEADALRAQNAAGVIANLHKPLPFPFVENFDDNTTGWPLKFDRAEVAIRDGQMEFENLLADAGLIFWSTKNFSVAPAGDFQLSLTLSALDGPDTAEAGLIFDLSATGRRVFSVTRKRLAYYSFDKNAFEPGHFSFESSALKSGQKNELTVRVFGPRAFLLVNGATVAAVDYPGANGPGLGVVVAAGTLATFDRIAAEPIKLDPAARTAEIKQREAEARATLIAAGPPVREFVDSFDDNRNHWPLAAADANNAMAIADGALSWTNRSPQGSRSFTVSPPLNHTADYSVSLRIRKVEGKDNMGTGLVWNQSADRKRAFGFVISGDGHWTVYELRDNKLTNLIPWRPSSLLKRKDQPHELTVRRTGANFYFFIDGQIVGDAPVPAPFGSAFGIEVPGGVTTTFDELKLSYPSQKIEDIAQAAARYAADLQAAIKRKDLGAASQASLREEAIAAAEAKAKASQPTPEDWAAQDKLSKKYERKKMLAVLADKGRPTRHNRDAGSHRLYYFHRKIGGVDYYMEFTCISTDTHAKGERLDTYTVISVGLTNQMR